MALPTKFEALRLPLVGAPMFIVSGPELVVAQCTSGIVGAFPALNARPETELRRWLDEIRRRCVAWDRTHPERPAAPFAVNLIVHRSNRRLEHDLAVCVAERVPIVITSLGARTEVNEAVRAYGGEVWHDVVDDRFARKAIDKGATGLIAVAAGAGGHAGPLSPFALVQEIRRWFEGPLALAGAIATGGSILAARALGADLAYVGTPFIATPEARAADGYRQQIVAGGARDVILTDRFSGVPANYLEASIRAVGLDPRALDGPIGTLDLDDQAGEGPRAWRDIWSAGQGIGAVEAITPARELVDRLVAEYRAAFERLDQDKEPWMGPDGRRRRGTDGR